MKRELCWLGQKKVPMPSPSWGEGMEAEEKPTMSGTFLKLTPFL